MWAVCVMCVACLCAAVTSAGGWETESCLDVFRFSIKSSVVSLGKVGIFKNNLFKVILTGLYYNTTHMPLCTLV